MATRRVIGMQADAFNGGGTEYASPVLPTQWLSTADGAAHRWLHQSAFRDQFVELDQPAGTGNAFTFTFMVKPPLGEWTDTALVITISDLDLIGTSAAVVLVEPGSFVTWRRDFTGTGGPSVVAIPNYCIVIDGTEFGVSGYGGVPIGAPNDSYRTPLLYPSEWFATASEYVGNLMSAKGALVMLGVDLTDGPGDGNSRTFLVETSDGDALPISLAFTGDEVSKTWIGIAACANGDHLRLKQSTTGTPAGATVKIATKYQAFVDGQSHVCGLVGSGTPTDSTQYSDPAGNHSGWTATEATVATKAGTQPFLLSKFRVRVGGPANNPIPPFSTVRAWDFRTRKNGSALMHVRIDGDGPFGGQDITASDATARGSFTASDTWDLECVPDTDPNSVVVSFGWIQSAFAALAASSGVIGPLAWVHRRRRNPDGTILTETYANQDMKCPGSWENGFKENRIESFGEAERVASEPWSGEWRGSQCRIRYSDHDRHFREQLSSSLQRYWATRVADTLSLTTRPNRAVLGAPFIAFTGPVVAINPVGPLSIETTLGDVVSQSLLSSGGSRVAKKADCPGRLARDGFWASLLVQAPIDPETPEPFILGRHVRVPDVDADSPQGFCVTPTYMGIEELDSVQYHVWLVAAHACADIPTIRVDGDEVAEGTDWLIPHHPNWTSAFTVQYVDKRSATFGNMRRYTLVYGKVTDLEASDEDLTDADACALGKKALTVAVCGVETEGDATGECIDDRLLQYKWVAIHLIANNGAREYQTGLYVDHPNPTWDAFGVTVPIVDETSFDICAAMAAERYPVTTNAIPGGGFYAPGYIGAAIIGARAGDRLALIDLIAEFNRSCNVQFTTTNLGQIRVFMIHPTEEVKAAAELYTHTGEILNSSFVAGFDMDRQANRIFGRTDFDHGSGEWKTNVVYTDDESVRNYDREIPSETIDLPYAPGRTMAYHLMVLIGRLRRHPPRPVTLAASIGPNAQGGSLGYVNPGDYLRYQHFSSISDSIGQIRLAQVQSVRIRPGKRGQSSVLVDCLDLEEHIDYDAYQGPREPGENDTCGTAVVISGTQPTNFVQWMDTTASGTDSSVAALLPAGYVANKAAWFEVTPAADSILHLATAGSDYDTFLAVFTGDCGDLTLLLFNDNDDLSFTSRLMDIPVTNGVTYRILVGSVNDDGGALGFAADVLAP